MICEQGIPRDSNNLQSQRNDDLRDILINPLLVDYSTMEHPLNLNLSLPQTPLPTPHNPTIDRDVRNNKIIYMPFVLTIVVTYEERQF
ncbi:hypothetical protein RJT34_05603 [Clitoria ternatea]|uniref:Uncharacterized protein n=1 Tax=Clitoria ternatea TaxID=43366 RepID=A0AAN9K2V6_CLITE